MKGARLFVRHIIALVTGARRSPDACLFARQIIALEAIGWHVVGFRPSTSGDEPALWRVTIERTDENASMTATEVNPEVALAELVRYTRADER